MPATTVERVVNYTNNTLTLENKETGTTYSLAPGETFKLNQWVPWASGSNFNNHHIRIQDGNTTHYIWQEKGGDGDHVRHSTTGYKSPDVSSRITGFSEVRWDRAPICIVVNSNGAVKGTLEPYANWMGDMAAQLKGRSLRKIAMPGTHDAGSYTIDPTRGGKTAPVGGLRGQLVGDLNDSVASKLVVRPVTAGWARAQGKTLIEQLDGGVRCFDLRIAYDNEEGTGEDRLCFHHGVYGGPALPELKKAAEWVKQHEQEIVILEFNSFGQEKDGFPHTTLINAIRSYFGDLLIKSSKDGKNLGASELIVDELWKSGRRVVVIYGSDAAKNQDDLFPGDTITGYYDEGEAGKIRDQPSLKEYLQKGINAHKKVASSKFSRFGGTFLQSPTIIICGMLWTLARIVGPIGAAVAAAAQICQGIAFRSFFGRPPEHLYDVAHAVNPIFAKWLADTWSQEELNVVNLDAFEVGDAVDTIVKLNAR